MTGEESGVKLLKQEIKDKVEQIRQGIVPEGYKETKVGIIPKDWQIKRLGEVLEFKNGINAKKEQYGTGIKFINVLDILNNNYIIYENIQDRVDINEKGFENNKVEYGDVLFQRSSETVEEAGTANIYLSDKPVTFGGFVIRGKKNGEFLPIYFNYMLKHSIYRKQVQRMAAGSTRYNIGQESLQGVYYCAPSTNEQQKIADILSTWDRAIELKESLIKEKEERKKGLMQRLLTSQDDWEEKSLGDISKIVTGTTPKTSVAKYYNGEYPWITPTDITDSKYIFSSERKLTKKGLEKGRYVPKGSLLVTCIASIGKNAILKNDGSCNQQINAIYPSDEHSNEFLYYLVSFNNNKLLSYAATTATAIINKQTFENIMFLIPPLSEQHRIAKILSTADQEIDLLKQEVEQLKKQKKGLMQLLLTGIVRVKEAVTSG